MISVNNFNPGVTFEIKGEIYVVLDAQHSKQARQAAKVKTKVKNLRTGSTTEMTFTGGEMVEQAHIDKRDMDYLYNSGEAIVLMDRESFEQIEIPLDKVEWELNFLKEGHKVQVRMYGGSEVLDIELPVNIPLQVTEAPEAVKGNSTNNPSKKIKVETGFELEAPMFIKEGEMILVSSETGKYVGRADK